MDFWNFKQKFGIFANKKETILFIIFFCLLLLTRFFCITQSFWLDEGITVSTIESNSLNGIFKFLENDLWPPFHYMTLKFWSYLGFSSELFYRFPSAIANIATSLLLFNFVSDHFSKKAGYIALMLFITSPFQINFAQEARGYAILGLLIIGILLTTVKFLHDQQKDHLKWYALLAAAALYTNYQIGIFLVVLNLCMLLFLTKNVSYFQKWLLAQVAVLLLFFPLIPLFIKQISTGGITWMPFEASHILMPWPDFFHPIERIYEPLFLSNLSMLRIFKLISGVIFVLYSYLFLKEKLYLDKKYLKNISLLAFIALGVYLLSYLISFKIFTFKAKYMYPISICWIILFSEMFSRLIEKRNILGLLTVFFFGLAQLNSFLSYYNTKNHREDWKNLVHFLEKNDNFGDNKIVCFHTQSVIAPFSFYNRNNKIQSFGIPDCTKFLRDNQTHKEKISLWVVDYLATLVDPNNELDKNLGELNFKTSGKLNFRRVGLEKWEEKKNL